MDAARARILITGPPGVGKTTAIKKTCQLLRVKGMTVAGFYTEEVRDSSRNRVGFDVVNLNGGRSVLARKDVAGSHARMPLVGQYKVDVRSFENTALLTFAEKSDVLVVDEVGKMELFSDKFIAAVREAFSERNGKIITTIPVPKGRPLQLVEELRQRPDCHIIDVTRENRDSVPLEIMNLISKS